MLILSRTYNIPPPLEPLGPVGPYGAMRAMVIVSAIGVAAATLAVFVPACLQP